jgi:hypothetical protein
MSFGQRPYDDPSRLKKVGVGKPETTEEQDMQVKMVKPQGSEGPSKQFMKTVNHKNDDKSLSKLNYQLGDQGLVLHTLKEQLKFSHHLRKELKKSSIKVGYENQDYQTMKKIMQDYGHEGFIFEKRKKRSIANNVLPTVKFTPLEIYGNSKLPDQLKKPSVPRKSEPFVMKRQGS